MLKKIMVMALIFSAISIPVIWKLNSTYSIYVNGENDFLEKVLSQERRFKSGELDLTKEQLLNMYVLTAKAEPSRYGMRYYYLMNIVLFISGFVAYIVGWYFGFREGKKSD